MKRFCWLMAAFLIGPALEGNRSARGDESRAEANARVEQIAADLTDLFDVILDHHVTPVTKQQMMQSCLAFGFRQSGRMMPADLVREISQSADNDDFRRILQRELPAILDGSDGNEIRLASALASIGVQVLPSKDQRINQQLAANRYVGIGIAIGVHNGGFPVMHKVFAGGPADQAGAKDGDQITEVDGKSTSGIDVNQAVEWLRGSEGSRVDLVLKHKGVERAVTMTRGVVPMKTVSAPVFSKSGESVGIKLERVSASNVHELRRIASALDASVKTVVIDFRRSSDTDRLHYGELLGNALLDGETIGFVADRTGNRRRLDAESGSIFSGRDLIVIVDRGTSGVLKWIAAALRDSGQAVLLGEPSAASAIATETFELNSEMSVAMPAKILYRSGGEQLFVRSDWPFGVDLRHVLERHRVQGIVGHQPRVDGALYPDKLFPLAPHTLRLPARYQGLLFPDHVRDLQQLLGFIEEGTLEPFSLGE